MVDEALRAWLRWILAWRRDGDSLNTERLQRLEASAYDALDLCQLELRTKIRRTGTSATARHNVMALYGHEPEFQDAT